MYGFEFVFIILIEQVLNKIGIKYKISFAKKFLLLIYQ